MLEVEKRSLELMISRRDWLVEKTHHPRLWVALLNTVRYNAAIVAMNKVIEGQRNYIEQLEDAHPLQLVHDQLFDLVDLLAFCAVTVEGEADGRTLRTDDGVIIVERDGVEQYRAVCGEAPFDASAVLSAGYQMTCNLKVNGWHLTGDEDVITLFSK